MPEIGEQAPTFTLPSTAGGMVSLEDELATGPVIVVTNRGHWCSYCAEQLQTYSHHGYDLWRNHGTSILPILGDPVSKLVEMRDRFDLGIQLLSDTGLDTVAAYAGTERSDRHGEIPRPSTTIIDDDGIVRYTHVGTNPSDRTYANYARHFVTAGMERPYGSD